MQIKIQVVTVKKHKDLGRSHVDTPIYLCCTL